MRKSLKGINWGATFGALLLLVLALWFLAANPDHEAQITSYKRPLEYIAGLLPPEGWTALFTCALFVSTVGLWQVTGQSVRLARNEFLSSQRPRVYVHSVEIDTH